MSGPDFEHLLVFPHLRVQNANTISSPLTHGFPSMTAFLGAMWALERRARAGGLDVSSKAVGVVCHRHQEQVTDNPFVKNLRLTRNPIDKDGSTAAIVEEGRIHLEISLIVAVSSERWMREPETRERDVLTLAEILEGMRIAGGSVLPSEPSQRWRDRPWIVDLTGTQDDQLREFRKARMRLLPGYALVSRDDQLEARFEELRVENPGATRLDAWLSLARVNWSYRVERGEGAWKSDRYKGQGWVVPIPVGYGALSELHAPGAVTNARDTSSPFRFVESLYSVGQWLSPHRVQSPRQLLWYADHRQEDGLYRCRNDYQVLNDSIEELYDSDF